MAKILEEMVVVRFSKIVKDSEKDKKVVNAEIISALEQLAQEVAGDSVIVEVIKE